MRWMVAGLAISICTLVAAASEKPGVWENLEKLRPGDRVRVELRGHKEVTAEFGAVLTDRLLLVQAKNQIDLRRPDIRGVFLKRKRSGVRTAAPWIGAAAGFGVGFAVGYPLGSPSGQDSQVDCRDSAFGCSSLKLVPDISRPVSGAIFGLVGMAAGATAGYFIGGARETLIYQSR